MDSTTIKVRNALKEEFPGTGDYAAIKVHKTVSVGHGATVDYHLSRARDHDSLHLDIDDSWQGYGLLCDLGYASPSADRIAGNRSESIGKNEMDTFPGADRHRNVWRLMVDPDRVGEHHLFRVDGRLRVSIIASEGLVRALEAIGATGIEPFLVS